MARQSAGQSNRVIQALYGDGHGYFDLPEVEERHIRSTRSSSVYGEIMPAAAAQLLDYLDLRRDDVLYDLGSGVGKFVLQAAMSHPLRKAVGVELARSRCRMAQRVLRAARRQGQIKSRQVGFRCADILQTYLADATVIYTCSTAFPPSFMDRLTRRLATLREGVVVVSLQELGDNPWFDPLDVLRLDMSWKRRTPVHVYELVNRRVARRR